MEYAKLMRLGFRVDESGALIGAAGLIFDSKGQPGIGATVPRKTHAQARVQLSAAARAAFTRDGLPVVVPAQGFMPPQNIGTPGPPNGTPSESSNIWRGQITFLFQRQIDQEPVPIHFPMIAVGAPNQNTESHRWPTRLNATTGFKLFPQEIANQLYNSPIPFGQMLVDPFHTDTDTKKWQVFYKIITADWCIFYELPSDSGNPPHNPMQGSYGVLLFSTAQAPGRVLFKVFVNQLCPPAFTRGGLPAGPRLTKNPPNGNDPNGAAQNPVAAAMNAAGVNPGPGVAASVPRVAAVPSMSSGTAPNINPAGIPGFNTATANQAAIDREMSQMALAQLGLTPAQLATAPPAQRQAILQRVQQLAIRMRAQQRHNMAARGADAAIGM